MMDKPIRSDVESSRSSVMEILMAHSLETTGKLPKLNYLTAEAFTFIDAGVDTAGRTLAAAVYYVLRTPSVEKKLQEELDSLSVWDSENTEDIVRNVGKLPYLVSPCPQYRPRVSLPLTMVPECGHQRGASYMAISSWAITSRRSLGGVASRVLLHSTGCMLNPSFQPGQDADFFETIISATHHSMHFDEDIFPEPKTFKPERWLRNDSTELNRYLTPYSRGSRACIGIK
jgi:cytochrome P450